MLEPLDERIAKEPKEFFDNIPATFHQKWRGKQYYLPIESGAVALFYNTDLFKAAEIAGPPKTWAEFAEISRKLTNPEKRIFAVTGTLQAEPPTNMTYDIYPLLLQAGAKIIDAATNKAVFNSPEGVAAIEAYVERINKDKVSGSRRAQQRREGEAGELRLRQRRHDVRGTVGRRHPEAAQPEAELRHRAAAGRQDHRAPWCADR